MKNILLFLFFVLSKCLFSIIINIPADQSTIQAGIDVAVDSDTVLVQPGTYFENTNYNGKNITVASLFLTTQDSSYIYQTVINGRNVESVVTFECGEDSLAVLSGFTITNGQGSSNYPDYKGGGITCINDSSPYINNLNIINNYSPCYGGGIYLRNSSPTIEQTSIIGNFASISGGGLYINDSSPRLNYIRILNNSGMNGGGFTIIYDSYPIMENLIIKYNTSNIGGGIHFFNAQNSICHVLRNSVISENTAYSRGGGIACDSYTLYLENVIIANNQADRKGGGIYCEDNSDLTLENVNIKTNSANDYGAGIYIRSSDLNFDNENRCNIYLNDIQSNRGLGSDIFAEDCGTINVIVDTFTVVNPSDFYASPIDSFTFDIIHGKEDNLINADLFVAVDGNDTNSGISPDEPLRTINYALSKIYANSINQNTIYLAPGIYSNSTNGEIFPIEWCSYVSLVGSDEDQTILDAENNNRVLDYNSVENALMQGIIIRNGSADVGGGIYCKESNLVFEDVVIKSNVAVAIGDYSKGGGIYLYGSEVSFINVIFIENISNKGGGMYCFSSNPHLENVIFTDNSVSGDGGAAYYEFSELSINNTFITGNFAEHDGGGFYIDSVPTNGLQVFENAIITENHAVHAGGGIYCTWSDIELHNLTIFQNVASVGGGIVFTISSPVFSSENRCSIYQNNAIDSRGAGTDIFAVMCNPINVIVDTFTVMNPTDYYTSPIDDFTFDILHSTEDNLIDADIYVAVNGDNSNSGINPSEPLKTIRYALSKIKNNNTIYLAPGVYSPSTNGETFPIIWSNYINLEGSGIEETILDAVGEKGVLKFYFSDDILIRDITVRNGSSKSGGGLYFYYSSPVIENLIITTNSAEAGGGIYCYSSSPVFSNITINDNSALSGGGIYCRSSSPEFNNVIIFNNNAEFGGAMMCNYSELMLENATFVNNSADEGGAMYCCESDITINNCIFWDDNPDEIFCFEWLDPSTITISYSDIQNGEAGITTNNNGIVNWLEGNIDSDPLFADPLNGDFHLTWANFPLPDSTMSPCIDAGNPNSPFDPDGTITDMGAFYFDQNQQEVEDLSILKPITILHQNYPNPFNPTTTISFNVTQTSSFVTIEIFNIKGQKVKSFLINQLPNSPINQIIWDGTDSNNKSVSTGIYFYKLIVDKKTVASKKCLLLK